MGMEEANGLKVECYAGHRGEQAPVRFFIGARCVAVTEVVDCWLAPSHRYFKLRGDDNGIYILRHSVPTDRWELTLFDSGAREQTRLSST